MKENEGSSACVKRVKKNLPEPCSTDRKKIFCPGYINVSAGIIILIVLFVCVIVIKGIVIVVVIIAAS